MTAKSVLQLFDNYQKARLSFVEHVADMASHAHNIAALDSAGVLCLLQSLLSDVCPTIQQYAAIAIGRLANHSDKISEHIVRLEMLPLMLNGIEKQNKFFKKATMFTLRAMAKHNPELAAIVINSGGLEAIINCMEDFDTNVKLAAVWAVGYIARHSRNLAQATIDAGVVPMLIMCLQEPEINLKQTAASALADIAKHGEVLAQTIADCSGSILLLSRCLNNHDEKLKRQVLFALDSIATHNVDLAETCVEAEIFPNVLLHIQHTCPSVSKAACTLTRDVIKHSLELAQLIVNQGGIAALLEATGDARLSSFAALGYIAGHSEQLALAVTGSDAVPILANSLDETGDQYLQATAAWTLGQIGKHSAEHARHIAEVNVLTKLVNLYTSPDSGEDLKTKTRNSLKQILQKCMVLSALEPLLYHAPPEILKYLLGQFAKVLPNDPRARRMFVTTGGLKKIQEICAEPGTTLMQYILCINSCFPDEIVRFYSPGYPETLLDKVEQYTPQVNVGDICRVKEEIEEEENLTPLPQSRTVSREYY